MTVAQYDEWEAKTKAYEGLNGDRESIESSLELISTDDEWEFLVKSRAPSRFEMVLTKEDVETLMKVRLKKVLAEMRDI